ncbi:MAG: oligosaccharide flippase family protein [Phycisphaeraceae bacterium]
MPDNPAQSAPIEPADSWSRRTKDRLTELPGMYILKGGGLRAAALKGSIWSVAGAAVAILLRLGSNLALAWMLFPEAFGLAQLISVVITGLQMFSDVGIGPAITQNRRGDDPIFLNTAWTIQIIRGVILSLISMVLAWPMAIFFNEPMLAQLIPVAGLTAMAAGFQSTAVHRATRHLQIGRLTAFQLVGQLAGAIAMVTWALVDRSVWALVAGPLIGVSISSALSFIMLKGHPHRLVINREALSELTKFGKWIFASTLVTFFGLTADRIVLGKLVDPGTLGVYGIALGLVMMCIQLVTRIDRGVFFPAFAKAQGDHQRLANMVNQVRLPLLFGSGLITFLAIVLAKPVITLLYDDRYLEAGAMAQILALLIFIQVSESNLGSLLLSLGRSRALFAGNLIKILTFAAFVLPAHQLVGTVGVIAALILSDIARHAVTTTLAIRARVLDLRMDIALQLLTLSATMALVLLLTVDPSLLAETNAPSIFLAATLTTLAAYALTIPMVIYPIIRKRRNRPPDSSCS